MDCKGFFDNWKYFRCIFLRGCCFCGFVGIIKMFVIVGRIKNCFIISVNNFGNYICVGYNGVIRIVFVWFFLIFCRIWFNILNGEKKDIYIY